MKTNQSLTAKAIEVCGEIKNVHYASARMEVGELYFCKIVRSDRGGYIAITLPILHEGRCVPSSLSAFIDRECDKFIETYGIQYGVCECLSLCKVTIPTVWIMQDCTYAEYAGIPAEISFTSLYESYLKANAGYCDAQSTIELICEGGAFKLAKYANDQYASKFYINPVSSFKSIGSPVESFVDGDIVTVTIEFTAEKYANEKGNLQPCAYVNIVNVVSKGQAEIDAKEAQISALKESISIMLAEGVAFNIDDVYNENKHLFSHRISGYNGHGQNIMKAIIKAELVGKELSYEAAETNYFNGMEGMEFGYGYRNMD